MGISNPIVRSDSEIISLIQANPPPATSQFLEAGTYRTLDYWFTNYPPSAAVVDKYANVSNLFNGTSLSAAGGEREVMRCRYDVANNVYNWVPQREGYNVTVTQTTGTFQAIPLVTPPTVRFANTLTGNLNLSALTTNAYVGLRQRFIAPTALGLFAMSITGALGSNLTILGGGARDMEYGATGWVISSS